MKNETTLIEAVDVKIKRDSQVILDGIDLSVESGEIVTLIGPNGAGKSTLVKALLGLEEINSGSIKRKPGLVVGYQAQRLEIDATLPLTVRRFLTLTLRRPDIELEEALEHVKLDQSLDKSIHILSGGEMQRVQLARAILRKPELLILDEPTQNVDITGAVDLYRLIQETRDRINCAVIMVSHDLNVVMSGTSRVYCLNNHICCSGQPSEVSQHPEFLKLFGQNGADMLAIYTHHHDHDHGPAGEVRAPHSHEHPHDHAH